MISTLKEVSKKVKEQKILNKKVGLITGCFDVLHYGHVQLFRFAKEHVDFLVVGLDNDKTISLTKGEDRPINKRRYRLEMISELRNVDMVFAIKDPVDYTNPDSAEIVYSKVIRQVSPDYLITTEKTDRYWKIKERRAKYFQIKFILFTSNEIISSTKIINKLNRIENQN